MFEQQVYSSSLKHGNFPMKEQACSLLLTSLFQLVTVLMIEQCWNNVFIMVEQHCSQCCSCWKAQAVLSNNKS